LFEPEVAGADGWRVRKARPRAPWPAGVHRGHAQMNVEFWAKHQNLKSNIQNRFQVATNRLLHLNKQSACTRSESSYLCRYFNLIMKEGTVKFFNETKGFGFLKETATGQEYFVHVSGLLVDTIRENDAVTFELKEGKKGLNAVNVRLAK
jgi:cold shock protein